MNSVTVRRCGGSEVPRRRVGSARGVCVVFEILFGLVTAISPSWACVPQPMLAVQPRASGPPGSEVTVDGANFQGGRVELRWNDSDGPLVGSAVGRTFSIPIRIPDVPPGLYALVALEREEDSSVGGVARTAFQLVDTLPTSPVGITSTEDAESPSTVFAVVLGAGGAIALLFAGAAGGAARARRGRADKRLGY